MHDDIETVIYNLLKMTRDKETAPDWALGLKLGEEAGEVQTALLYANGFLRHKTLDEDVMHEVADVFNVCLGLLTQHYPDLTPEEILSQFNTALYVKGKKYAKVLAEGCNG
jgi:phosphoribosyl-ATP pyrophosphohydrolase